MSNYGNGIRYMQRCVRDSERQGLYLEDLYSRDLIDKVNRDSGIYFCFLYEKYVMDLMSKKGGGILKSYISPLSIWQTRA